MPAAAAIPEPTNDCVSRVKDIDTLGNKVFVANAGSGTGCYDGVLAADSRTGKLLWQNHCLGATEAIKAIGNWLYKGSHAHDCSRSGAFKDGNGTRHLLVESATTGKLGPWFPNTNGGGTTEVGPLAFASGGSDLWVGGDFTLVNGRRQQGLTRFSNAIGGAQPAKPVAPKVSSTRAGTGDGQLPASGGHGQHHADLHAVPRYDQGRHLETRLVSMAEADRGHLQRHAASSAARRSTTACRSPTAATSAIGPSAAVKIR